MHLGKRRTRGTEDETPEAGKGVGCPLSKHSSEAPAERFERGHPTPLPLGALVLKDRDGAALAGALELDRPRPSREDRVVAAEAGAVAGPEAGAALADDDLAAGDLLAGENLDPKHLGVGFASVAA